MNIILSFMLCDSALIFNNIHFDIAHVSWLLVLVCLSLDDDPLWSNAVTCRGET